MIIFLILLDQFDKNFGRFEHDSSIFGVCAVIRVDVAIPLLENTFLVGIQVDTNQFLYTALFRFHFHIKINQDNHI